MGSLGGGSGCGFDFPGGFGVVFVEGVNGGFLIKGRRGGGGCGSLGFGRGGGVVEEVSRWTVC